jgi:hypothetical protein
MILGLWVRGQVDRAQRPQENEETAMPMEGRTTCAVPNCGAPISGYGNLCDSHRIPGAIVRMNDNTMIIAAWEVEHEHEYGIVVLNDFAAGDLFGGRAGFEAKLRKQGFVNVNLLRTPEELEAAKQSAEGKKAGDWGGPWRTQYPWEVAKAPDGCGDPALDDASNYFGDLPEPSRQQKPEKPALTPADPSDPKASRNSRVSELLVAISDAILSCIEPAVAGTLKQGSTADPAPIDKGFMWLRTTPAEMSRLLGPSPAEADLAAAVALFPAGVRALITARVDARVQVSSSEGTPDVSIWQCNEPAFLFQELSEPYDATHALHLVCDPAEDTSYTFVMIEFSAGKFAPSGWVDGEAAAKYAAEARKGATGRPPDFHGTAGKLPK